MKRKKKKKHFFLNFLRYFKLDSTTLDLDPNLAPEPNPDQNWAKIMDPVPNSMYLDPRHWWKICNPLFEST